jgi:Rod binding domain-containing protein
MINNIGAGLAAIHTADQGAEKAQSLIRGAHGVKQDGELDKIAQDFESVFITEMIRPVFEAMEVDTTFGGGRAEEVFRSMMLDEYGKTLSQAGGVGLSDYVKSELIKMQGVSFEEAATQTKQPSNDTIKEGKNHE